MTTKHDADDGDLLIALRHPLRRQILRTMGDDGRSSPRQLSDELDEVLSSVSYHVRVLADRGAIALVDTTPVRGTVEHFYARTISEPWALAVLGRSDEDDDGATESPASSGEAPDVQAGLDEQAGDQ